MSRLGGHFAIFAAAMFCALSVGYFYMLDRFLFSSGHFSPIFRILLVTYDVKAAWLGLAACLLAPLWHRPAPILRWVDFIAQRPVWIALVGVAILTLGAIVVYHGCPLSMDEYASVFQSKIFASGNVVAQLPRDLIDWLVVRGFNGPFLIASSESGRAVEAYWPGFALLLFPFQWLNVPWLCNATLSGLSLYLIYWITREITGDRRAGGWAMLFTLASAAFIADGISYYSMQAHLTANLLFAALLLRPSGFRAFCAGLVGSLALVLHNPVPHALFAVPWIGAMAVQPGRRRYLLPLLLGYLPGVALGLFWLGLRSEIGLSRHGVVAWNGISSGVFAWPDATMLNNRAAALIKLCIWAMPGLLVFAILGFARHRADARVRLLASSAVLTFVAYVFVRFDQGHGWGFRYFHSAWGVVPILAGCFMTYRSQVNPRLVSFAGAIALLSILFLVPFQMSQVDRFIIQHLAQLGPPRRPGNNIYFIHPLGGFYVADMIQFDPLLRGQDLLLVSHGAKLDEQLIQRNWQGGVKVSGSEAADQYYLGTEDRRRPIPGSKNDRQFVIADVPR